jgi:ribosomal protein S12 methylthiotransferase
MGKLAAHGIEVVHEENPEGAQVAIVNTCGFINDAKEESIDSILQLLAAKKQGQFERVIVMGCLSQRYRSDLKKELPGVDEFFGVDEQLDILKTLGVDYRKELLGERTITTPQHYSYLKIAEGCDRECSFCAIPLIRGKNISRPMDELVHEAEILVNSGVKELNLIAQDTTWYGLDIYGKRNLASLLEKLSDVKGLEWIRLHYAYPHGFPVNVLDVIRDRPNICKYLDIPLQHINGNILKSMRRGVSKDQSLRLLENIRTTIPNIHIRTTLITGYPGEGEKEFQELVDFVKEQRFERLGVFTYSPEEDTPAYPLGDPIPQKEKQARLEEIMRIQSDISAELNFQKINSVMKVLIDSKEANTYIGRTEFDSPEVDNEILITNSKKTIEIGQFYDVKIIDADAYDLTAVLE